MVDIVGNDRAAARDLVPDEFGRDVIGDRGAEILAVADQCILQLSAAHILADRDIFHFGGDDAAPGVMHLADVRAGLCAQRAFHDVGELRDAGGAIGAGQAVVFGADLARVIFLDIAARDDPVAAQLTQAGIDVDQRLGVGVRAAGVVDAKRGFAARRVEHDLTHGDAQRADMYLAAAANGTCRDADFGAGGDVGHDIRSKCSERGHGFREANAAPSLRRL